MSPEEDRRQHDAIWKKLDEHGQDIAGVRQEITSVHGRVNALEVRLDLILTGQAEGRSEMRSMMHDLHEDVKDLNANYYQHMGKAQGYKEAAKEFSGWKQWIVPVVISVMMLLIALGIIGSGQ